MSKDLTLIIPVIPDEVTALRQILHDMGQDVMHNPHVQFPRSRLTHFARFALLPDTMPAQTDLTPHLLFSSNYDGTLDEYLSELLKISPGLDEIFGRCEGYPGREHFHEFVRRHHHDASAFFVAFRDEDASQIRTYKRLREQLDAFLDENPQFVSAFNDVMSINAGAGTNFVQRVFDGLKSAAVRVFKLLVTPFKWLGKWILFPPWKELDPFSGIRINLQRTDEDIKHIQELAAFENLVVQNQMIILSEVKPGQLGMLKRFLAFVNLAARLSPPGELAGLRTIHFARWVLFDNDRRLLFLSNYDGTWENYIGDFVNQLSDGLNAIWRNTVDFPETGPPDLAAFHEHIRTHQIRSLVFYSAYPDQTVINILNNRIVVRQLAKIAQRPGLFDAIRRL